MTELRAVPHVVILGAMAAICLGVPISLYWLLTMGQRRVTSEIRRGIALRGWRYRNRSGGFRIDGSTGAGVIWVMTSGNSSEGERRWSCELDLRFPALGGETDIVILPRGGGPLPSALPAAIEARIAKFSGTLAGAARFLRDAHEVPSGVVAFDAAYEVRAKQDACPTVDAGLAERILSWPADAVAPHSMVAWRDPFGFHLNARLPGPPNWATVAWLASVGEECTARLPAVVAMPPPSGWVDRVIAGFLRF